MIETTSLTIQTHSIYHVVVEDLDLHYKPSLSMYWLLPMQFVVGYSRQFGFYHMIHYQVMAYNEDLYPPPPHDILNVFAAADLSSQSSYESVKYKRSQHRAKGIHSSILSSGESPDARSRALSVAMNHKEIASIISIHHIIT